MMHACYNKQNWPWRVIEPNYFNFYSQVCPRYDWPAYSVPALLLGWVIVYLSCLWQIPSSLHSILFGQWIRMIPPSPAKILCTLTCAPDGYKQLLQLSTSSTSHARPSLSAFWYYSETCLIRPPLPSRKVVFQERWLSKQLQFTWMLMVG